MKFSRKKVGVINETVIQLLNLSLEPGTPIFISETNIDHIKDKHPEDYEKYGHKLTDILSFPDYIAEHPRNGSIQYIKVFFDEAEEKRVLVAVRTTKRGILFARSLFVMSDEKVKSYEKRNAFKAYKEKN